MNEGTRDSGSSDTYTRMVVEKQQKGQHNAKINYHHDRNSHSHNYAFVKLLSRTSGKLQSRLVSRILTIFLSPDQVQGVVSTVPLAKLQHYDASES
jgi:hypothetical protein